MSGIRDFSRKGLMARLVITGASGDPLATVLVAAVLDSKLVVSENKGADGACILTTAT
jgi:hypothetical protein